jgi:hypothetical protein
LDVPNTRANRAWFLTAFTRSRRSANAEPLRMLRAVSAGITITFPAEAEYLRLARLAAADAASRAGFDVDAIDDVRIAVSELCGARGAGGNITLRLVAVPGRLEVQGQADVALTPHLDGLTRTVVGGVVDSYHLSSEPVGAFSFVKAAHA